MIAAHRGKCRTCGRGSDDEFLSQKEILTGDKELLAPNERRIKELQPKVAEQRETIELLRDLQMNIVEICNETVVSDSSRKHLEKVITTIKEVLERG